MSVKLDTINAMLIATDEAPVSDENSMHPSALQASTWFDLNNVRFQQRGWWFNTEYDLKLSPNESSRIVLPDGTLKLVLISRPNYYVKRGQYLYDPVRHSFEFSDPVYANVVLQIAPDDLPSPAIQFLGAKCVYDYYCHAGSGDSGTLARCKEDWLIAKAQITDAEIQEARINAFQSPGAFSIISRLPSSGWSHNPINPRG